MPFAVGVGVEDKAFDTKSVLLAGLIDQVDLNALVDVLCPRNLENEEERLDKVDCTDKMYDDEEALVADVCCTDKEEVKEPLILCAEGTNVGVLFKTRLERDRDEKGLRVHAVFDIALELLETKEIATKAKQKVQETILGKAEEGKLIDDGHHNC